MDTTLLTSAEPARAGGGVERRGAVLDVLQELLAEQRNAEVLALFAKLVARNGELERQLAQLLMRRNKGEGISTAQLKLFIDALAKTNSGPASEGASGETALGQANEKLRAASGIDKNGNEEKTKAPRQPPLRRPLPPALPRVENLIRVPAEERACPLCGAERTCIGHEITEVIELVPAQVVIRVDKREKLGCTPCDGELVRAPMGDKVVEGGRIGSTLVAQLLADKYDDGLPLHRQKQRFARMGLDLPIATLADQVTWGTDLLRPLWRVAQDLVVAAKVMHLDATSLPVLDKAATGGRRLGALWGYVADDVALYLYASTGKKTGQKPGEIGPEEMLARRVGYVVADAASQYDESFKRDDLIECGCNMHARRRFTKALEGGDSRAALPLAAYKKLYEIEAKIRDLSDEEKLVVRQADSKPVWEELARWCDAYAPHTPPSSPLGAAIRYNQNHRDALGRFLECGAVPMDNGVVERLHVRAALTRKNFLFAGSDAGGERAAIAFTILGCCRLAGVNPVDYLADVLPRLARTVRLKDVPALLPARWKAARAATASSSSDPPSG